jgi:cytochrome c oxidase subunit IV
MSENSAHPYRVYWVTWGILLVITVGMLAAEKFHMPKWFLITFLLTFMAVKAVMIAGTFMHLRFEKRNLAVMVGAGIVVTSLILYAYVSQETARIMHLTPR